MVQTEDQVRRHRRLQEACAARLRRPSPNLALPMASGPCLEAQFGLLPRKEQPVLSHLHAFVVSLGPQTWGAACLLQSTLHGVSKQEHRDCDQTGTAMPVGTGGRTILNCDTSGLPPRILSVAQTRLIIQDLGKFLQVSP